MDEDLDQELQNLKSINSKKDNPEYKYKNKNNSSPIFNTTQDQNEDSGTFNPDLKLVYSDTNNDSISIHESNNFNFSKLKSPEYYNRNEVKDNNHDIENN